jgi:hypothetical protein
MVIVVTVVEVACSTCTISTNVPHLKFVPHAPHTFYVQIARCPWDGGQKISMLLTEPMYNTEAEFSDVIGTKVLRVFLLAIHSHLY